MWRLCDMHIHSIPNEQVLDDVSPETLIRSFTDVDLVAITNHDTVEGVKTFLEAGAAHGVDVVAGVEVTTNHGHLLVLCPGPDGLGVLEDFVLRVGIEPSAPQEFEEVVSTAQQGRGPTTGPFGPRLLLIGAHVDADGSLLAAKQPLGIEGQIALAQRLDALEVQDDLKREQWIRGGVKGTGRPMPLVRSSDLHGVGGPRRPTWIYLPNVTAADFRHAFSLPECSIRFNDRPPSPAYRISSISIEGGMHDGKKWEFDERTTAIIGAPLSGKSLVLDSLRFAFGLECDIPDVAAISRSRLDRALGAGGRIIVKGTTPDGPFSIERTWGGAQVPDPPFLPIVFGQQELVRRGMESDPSISLLDIHCEEVASLQDAHVRIRQETAALFSTALAKAREAAQLSERVDNPEDGLVATRNRIDGLAGSEDIARQATDVSRVEEWRQSILDTAADWASSFSPPEGPALPSLLESSLTLPSEAPPLPTEALETAIEEWEEGMRRSAEELMQQLREIITRTDEQWADVLARVNEGLAVAGVEQESEVLRELGELRNRLSSLEADRGRLNNLNSEVDALLAQLRDAVQDAEDTHADLRRARQAGLRRVNASMPSFFCQLEDAGSPENLDLLLSEAKRGTFMREPTLGEIRESLNRFRLLEVAIRSEQGEPHGVPADSRFAGQDDIARNAVSRMPDQLPEDHLAITAATFAGDRLGLFYKSDGDPEPFQSLTEGMRALAIKEISFAASELPVITDQPEDAVPPQNVYENLVPTIRRQRMQRQFILASHDANIVVAGDVELVHVLGRDSATGTLYDERVLRAAMELLEGGPEAFERRGRRYRAVDS